MPKVAKLTKAEVDELTKRRVSTIDLSEYVEIIKGFRPGEWGRLELEPNETQRVVKRRLTTAAKLQGVKLRYRLDKDQQDRILFRVG